MGELRDFKFHGQVDHIKPQPMDDKSSQKGVWSHYVNNFKFLVPRKYLGNG